MDQQDQEIIREFLVESHENLARLDLDLVALEQRPRDAELLAAIFRTMHTIKGTCGFLAFSTLEAISHQAETLLSQLRAGERELNPAIVSLILETVDATRHVLASIEARGDEGPDRFEELTGRLRAAAGETTPAQTHPAPPSTMPPSPVMNVSVRVGVPLLDRLMDLVGELVLTRNQILQSTAGVEQAAFQAASQRLNRITSELQASVMQTRMQPIAMVWNHLPRVVRDMALSLGKQIRLVMAGAETELDRTIIEAIKDPLVHLVRNACGHGIETPEARALAGKPPEATITLRAFHEGGQVNIEISDDGAGIDLARVKQNAVEKQLLRPDQAAALTAREALRLVFLPGFSTARTVTSVSGRGVGLDVVKSHIEKIGGVVDLASLPGAGLTVKLRIPLTLAIIPGLVITSGGERFVIPQVSLLELIRIEADAAGKRIELVHGTPFYRRRGALLPLTRLNDVLALPAAPAHLATSIVVLQAEQRQFGLIVDAIHDTQEIVVKPLGRQLKGLGLYAGATIMGDGRVALILDVPGIGLRSGVLSAFAEQRRAAVENKQAAAIELQPLLLFRTGSFHRLAVPLSLVARLEECAQSSIEYAGGRSVVQYRGRILPLVTLRGILEPGAPAPHPPPDPLQVIVFTSGERSLGVVVDQILDVAEAAVTVRQQSGRAGLLGSAVAGNQVTDFLDLNYVLHSAAENWLHEAAAPTRELCVLLAASSTFTRGLIRGGLDMAGYRVLEAAHQDEALHRLGLHPVDVLVAAPDLAPNGSSALHAAMRRRPEWASIPVIALEQQAHFDQKSLLASLAGLAEALALAAAAPVCPGVEA